MNYREYTSLLMWHLILRKYYVLSY